MDYYLDDAQNIVFYMFELLLRMYMSNYNGVHILHAAA
jgi:hypothetical protein